jgi:membrane dipeptidase
LIVVDGHLDIAFNALCHDRDPRASALETRAREGDRAEEPLRGRCMVGLPELRAGRIAVVFGTLFLSPRDCWTGSGHVERITYENAEEAERRALDQLAFYHELAEEEGSGFRIVEQRGDLEVILGGWENGATGEVGVVPLMEGADPIRDPDGAPGWFDRGVRIIGLAWHRTRYAGGTGAPGPLPEEGRKLGRALDRAGLGLDLSHASEESFHEALDLFDGPAIASHSNPRKICPGDRQISDAMIRRIAERGGVVGIVPCAGMLQEGWRRAGKPAVPLRRVAEAVHHVAQVAGTHRAAGVGSDFDGGFGAEAAPRGLDTIADLPCLADPLSDLDFSDEAIHDILGRNWIRYLERLLPTA